MKHLNKQPNPSEILENQEVTISQKLDGAAFGVKKQNGKLYYFGREGKKPISKEKLMTLDLYNNIIVFIEEQIQMEDGDFIQGELFPESLKPIVTVEQPPKNEFVVFNTNLDIKYISQFFNISLPIFTGKLDITKINTLIELSNSEMTNKEWTRRVLDVINSNFIPLINREEIEGLVIRVNENFYKIVNPKFTNQVINKKELSDQTFNKKELYEEFTEIIFNQFLSQFNPGVNVRENIEHFFVELVDYMRNLNIEKEEPVDYMTLNSSMMNNYRGIDLSDVYLSVKGTKLESAIWFLFNAIYLERKKATSFFGKDIIQKINQIREIFGISKDDVKLETIQTKFIEKIIFK